MEVIEPHVSAPLGAEACSDGLSGDVIHELRVTQTETSNVIGSFTQVRERSNGSNSVVQSPNSSSLSARSRDFTSPEHYEAGRLDPEVPVQEGAKVNLEKAGEDRATIRDGTAVKATSILPAPGRQQSQRTISSVDMFEALVEDMAESPNVGQVEAWRTTIKALFAEANSAVPV
ncbi:uncharacterized protein CCR75_009025 [Bremia lactucae]|uniref:Uncharacterized protein n=1 Tax=Bremia lactucae TaxID=4779 RepID=A0A976IBD6_BRELC|nr:hypothetical protein CCR75_009025 [Bremia lactucae]